MRPRARLLALLLALVAACAAAPQQSTGAVQGAQKPWGGKARRPLYVDGEVLVQYKSGATAVSKAATLAAAGAQHKGVVTRATKGRGELAHARLTKGQSVEEAVAALSRRSDVAWAQPNYKYYKACVDTPNDPAYTAGSLWGMQSGSGSNAAGAWAAGKTDCSGVVVAVIDEGVQITHPDLAANIWVNPYDPVDGADNDGNGYIDDVNGRAWDFVHEDNSVYDAADGDDHGTHVSGIIAAVGGNSIGVVGTCWKAKLLSMKFLGPNGGETVGAVRALYYLTDMKTRHGLPIVASSNSWGGSGRDPALLTAIRAAYAQDILFIAAAGNSATSEPSYPAAFSLETAAVISVAAIDNSSARASFSNYGTTLSPTHVPPSRCAADADSRTSLHSSRTLLQVPTDTYQWYQGTSMATPHVSGAAALYKAYHPTATAAVVRAAILEAARQTPTASLANEVTTTGGRLNVATLMGIAPCSSACTSAQYCDVATGTCKDCPSQCSTCAGPSLCESCWPGVGNPPACDKVYTWIDMASLATLDPTLPLPYAWPSVPFSSGSSRSIPQLDTLCGADLQPLGSTGAGGRFADATFQKIIARLISCPPAVNASMEDSIYEEDIDLGRCSCYVNDDVAGGTSGGLGSLSSSVAAGYLPLRCAQGCYPTYPAASGDCYGSFARLALLPGWRYWVVVLPWYNSNVLNVAFTATGASCNATLIDGFRTALATQLGVAKDAVAVTCTVALRGTQQRRLRGEEAGAAAPAEACAPAGPVAAPGDGPARRRLLASLGLKAAVAFSSPQKMAQVKDAVLQQAAAGTLAKQIVQALPAAAKKLVSGVTVSKSGITASTKVVPAPPPPLKLAKPAKPAQYSKLQVSSSAAKILIRPSAGATDYTIKCTALQAPRQVVKSVAIKRGTTVIAFTVTKLAPKTAYKASITAVNKAGASAALVVPFTTKA
eukprot:scaffold4.g4583.t1